MQKNMYMPDLAKVVSIREETAHTRSLLLALEKEKPVVIGPGQFIELTLFGHGEFPVSVADVIAGSPQRFLVTIQEMGKVTRGSGPTPGGRASWNPRPVRTWLSPEGLRRPGR